MSRPFSTLLVTAAIMLGVLGLVPRSALALDGVRLDSIEYTVNQEGWAQFGSAPVYQFRVGDSVGVRFGVTSSLSVPAGFNIELTGNQSPTLVDVFTQLSTGTNVLNVQLPTFSEPGQKRVRMWGESIEMPKPSTMDLAKFAGETLFNIYNKASSDGSLPPLPPQRPNVVTISLEARERDTESSLQLLINGSAAAEIRAGQSQQVRVPANATVVAVANIADGEEFKGWTTMVVPPGVTPCSSTATSCQVFSGTGNDTVFGAQLTAQVSKKVIMSKLTLAQVGTGNIVMIKTEPESSPVTVCMGCAPTTYEFPLGTVIELGAVDAEKTGRWTSTNSFCVSNPLGDLTRCKGELPETPVTATATFTQCTTDPNAASLVVGDATAPQCATVTVNKVSREGATGSVTETGSGTPLGLSCGTTCTTKTAGGLADGRTITLTAVPSSGYFFSGWTGASGCGTSPTCSFSFDGSKTVTATFSGIAITPTDRYTVSYSSNGTGSALGTLTASLANGNQISSGTAVDAGTVVTFSAAIPSTAGKFISWGGACSGSASTCTVTANAAVNVTARFERYLSVQVVGYAQSSTYGTPNGAVNIKYKDALTAEQSLNCAGSCGTRTVRVLAASPSVTVTASPDAVSEIAKWTNACSGTARTCTIAPTTDAIMRVEFKIPTYTVTVNIRGTIIGTAMQVVAQMGDTAGHNLTHARTKDCKVSDSCVGWTWYNVHKGQGITMINVAPAGATVTYSGCNVDPTAGACGPVNSDRTITVTANGGSGGILAQTGAGNMLARVYSTVTSLAVRVIEPLSATVARATQGAERLLAAVGIGAADLTPYDLYQTPEGAGVDMAMNFFGSVGNVGSLALNGNATSTLRIEQKVNEAWSQVGQSVAVSTNIPARQFAFPAWQAAWTPRTAGTYRARFCVVTPSGSESNTNNNCSLYRQFTVGSTYVPPVPPKQKVVVTASGGGALSSVVNTSDTNFASCKGSCSRAFRDGATLTLTAIPDAGKRFVRFDGLSGSECPNASLVSNHNVCALTVKAYKAVTAIFAPADTLTLCGDADRSGSVLSSDSLRVLDYAVGKWSDINLKNADANGDGKITSSDSALILKAATGSAKLENVAGVCKYTLL